MKMQSLIQKPFRYVFWNAAYILIGINLLVFILTTLYPRTSDYLSLNPLFVIEGKMYWQIFTYQFVHGGFSHLFFNMFALLFFGQSVEHRIGSKEFLLFYLLSGTLCGLLSLGLYVATGTWYVFLMGASGAIFALLLAYAVLFPDSVIYIWGIIPVPAPILVLGYTVLEVFSMITGSTQGVAHSAHLIGFAVGWGYFLLRFRINPAKVWFKHR